MGKYFVVDESINTLSKDVVLEIEARKSIRIDSELTQKETIAEQVFAEKDTLKSLHNRVIVKIDMEGKNYHTFDGGMKIRRERQFNNLNFRETVPVNATVISSEKIPEGAEILVDYHAVHDSNRIFNYKSKSPQIQYFSIKINDCYLWNDGKEWHPVPPYELALRVFKKYEGIISWMKPEKMDNILYVTTGELKGKIIMTLIACDYECVFQDRNGREGNRIRFLPFGDPSVNKEEEAIAIRHDLMKELKNGTLMIGYSLSDCKTLNEYYGN